METDSILFPIADEQSSKGSSSVAQHIKALIQIQKTNNLEHFLLSSHWKLKSWWFQETCFSLLIILNLSIHLSHFLIFLCSFFLCWCTIFYCSSQVCLLENSSICPSHVFCWVDGVRPARKEFTLSTASASGVLIWNSVLCPLPERITFKKKKTFSVKLISSL